MKSDKKLFDKKPIQSLSKLKVHVNNDLFNW